MSFFDAFRSRHERQALKHKAHLEAKRKQMEEMLAALKAPEKTSKPAGTTSTSGGTWSWSGPTTTSYPWATSWWNQSWSGWPSFETGDLLHVPEPSQRARCMTVSVIDADRWWDGNHVLWREAIPFDGLHNAKDCPYGF